MVGAATDSMPRSRVGPHRSKKARGRLRGAGGGRPRPSSQSVRGRSGTPPAVRAGARGEGAAAAEDDARELLDAPDVLAQVAEAMRTNGYAGDLMPAKLAYVALTSRLLERPMNLAFVAEAAAGKNWTVNAARALVPPEDVHVFSAGSPRALLYTDKGFRNRVVVFTEADCIPHNTAAASAVRALAEGNALSYEVTTLNRQTGQFETQTRIKPGPTALITTSTRPLRPPFDTHLLRVPVEGNEETTREVLLRKGQEAAGETPPRRDVRPFQAFQRWLRERGEHRVIVPFGETLAEAMPSTFDARMRRDFIQLLSCVQTLALLHQRQRDRGRDGAIVASFADYRVARDLLEMSFYLAAADDLTPAIRETVQAIRRAKTPPSEADLARELRVTRQAIWGRLRTPLEKRWIVNDERVPGRPARLRCDRPLPEVQTALPEASHVEGWFWGIPNPEPSMLFFEFAAVIAADWPAGLTAAGEAERVQRDPEVVRARLDALASAGYLDHDSITDRYRLPEWVQETLARREDDRPQEEAPAPQGTEEQQPDEVSAREMDRQLRAGQEDDQSKGQAPAPQGTEDRQPDAGPPQALGGQEEDRPREQTPAPQGTEDGQPGVVGTADKGRLDDE